MSEYRVAKEDLYIPGPEGVKAFNKGDSNVPAELVERWGWSASVVGPNTKTAAKLKTDARSDESDRNVTTGGALTPGKGD